MLRGSRAVLESIARSPLQDTALPMRQRFALVFNARAGVARPRLLDGVLSGVRGAGGRVFQVAARSAEEAAEQVADLARTGGADCVIAAGGDGTFRAVATGAGDTALPVGFVPLGTGNVLKHEIGLTSRAGELARGLLHNPVVSVRGGRVNGAPFFLMAGAGFDGRIVAGLNYKTKRMLGRAAYTGPVTQTLARGADTFDVDIDGRALTASWVIVTNAAHYGGSFILTRETQLGASQLVAVVVTSSTRRALIGASLALGLGRLARPETRPAGMQVLPATRVKIGFQMPVPGEIDGDDAGLTPFEVTNDGPTVQLIVPPAYVADLTKRHTNHVP